MNFVPTRPVEEITKEYIAAFWYLYEPLPYLKRTFRHFRMMNGWRGKTNRLLTHHQWQLLLAICWRQGIVRSTRFHFWWQWMVIALTKPSLLYDYLTALALGEHFFSYRHTVKAQLLSQLEELAAYQLNESQNARMGEVATVH
jgi:hypothetical protein